MNNNDNGVRVDEISVGTIQPQQSSGNESTNQPLPRPPRSTTPSKNWTRFDEDGNEIRISRDDHNSKTAATTTAVATLEPSQTFQVMNTSYYDGNSNLAANVNNSFGSGVGGGSDTPVSSKSRSVSPLSKIPPPPAATPRKSQPSVSTTIVSDNPAITTARVSSDSTTINVNNSVKSVESPVSVAIPSPSSPSSSSVSFAPSTTTSNLQNIPLKEIPGSQSSITSQKSFSNGDIIVSLLPLNTHCAWTTPATFKPELVPEELMAQGLRLTVEDYVTAMQILVNDYRFNLYIVFYKRILVIWIALGFFVLLSLLFSGAKGLALFGGGVIWLIINAFGIFISMWTKLKLYRSLERCVARVNELLYKNNVLVGVDDRGKLSCHKVNLVFIYFDVNYCIKYLNDMLANEAAREASGASANTVPKPSSSFSFSRHDIEASDIIITGTSPRRVSQKEKYGEKLLLRYSQRWIKEYVRSRIDLNMPLHSDGSLPSSSGALPSLPTRHCAKSRCPCQFIEEHLKFKPGAKFSWSELF